MGCLPTHLLRSRRRSIKVMTMDGGCLRFGSPAIAKEVLMEHPRHALFLFDSVRSLGLRARPLPPASRLQTRHVYFLVPLPTISSSPLHSDTSTRPLASTAIAAAPAIAPVRRKVSFASSPADNAVAAPVCVGRCLSSVSAGSPANMRKSSVELLPSPAEGVLRLKMVVSKKQLASLLQGGRDRASTAEGLLFSLLRESEASAVPIPQSHISGDGWKPSLSTIPEAALQRCGLSDRNTCSSDQSS